MKNFFKHLHTVLKHKYLVFIHACKCGIPLQGLLHDLSKFTPSEFNKSVKYYNGHFSPIVNERKNEGMYSSVFTHHTNHNKHHYEYWISEFNGDFVLPIIPYKYSIEYVCDMIAASKTYLGKDYNANEPLKFFLSRCDHYLMHSMNKKFIYLLLKEYSLNGFKALKKRKTQELYNSLKKEYPFNEYIHCYSLNNKFIKEDITDEFIKKVFSKKI